ncbi:MAG TPA: hypothetical protein VI432_03155 [Candidatus Paceibacterota bacterium]
MTVIRPNRKNNIIKLILVLSGVLMVVFGSGVHIYSDVVSLKHEGEIGQDRLNAETVKNAELKNTLYAMIDPSNLAEVALKRGLIKDKNPQWAFASRY